MRSFEDALLVENFGSLLQKRVDLVAVSKVARLI